MRMLIIFSLTLIFFVPAVAWGQVDSGLVTCEGPDCNWCSFVKLINNLVTWLIIFLSAVATLALVVAGFKLVTSGGNVAAWSSAKSMFTNIVIGFIIVLAAWLIVDTVLRLLTDKGGINEWIPSECGGALAPIASTGGAGTSTSGGVTGTPGTPVTPGSAAGKYSNADGRKALADAGISIWESAPGRTSLEGINQTTVQEGIRIRNACNCNVTVTGGTESGHAGGTYSHGTGYKIDLDDSAGLTTYIQSNYTRAGSRSDGTLIYKDVSRPNVEYALEPGATSHWDITVQ